MMRRLKPVLLRVYRAGVLVVILWLVHEQHQWFKAQSGPALTVARVTSFFPGATSLGPVNPGTGVQAVLDAAGQKLGQVTQTAPLSDKIIGYAGPTNTLIALDLQARVTGIRVLHSDDTADHLAEVIKTRSFFNSFKGLKLGDTQAEVKVDAVSGATLTSTAIAEGVRRRLGQQGSSLRFPEEITLMEVQAVVPGAASLQPLSKQAGVFKVLDAQGTTLARVTRTSPVSDAIVGYKGPSDTLMVLDAKGEKLTSIRVRKSFDTKDYVASMTGDSYFMSLFNGMPVGKLGTLDFKEAKVEGVSGATQTSWSMAEGLKRRAKMLADQQASKGHWLAALSLKAGDWLLLGVLGLSLLMTFAPLRGQRWARWLHHALLIGYAGLFSGAMLSQGLLVGWTRHGVPWQSAPVLVLLAALALALPLFTRRQFYCHHYCPHGALQQVLAHRVKWQLRIPATLSRLLEKLPWLLLVLVLSSVMLGWEINLNALEPFDAWLIRIAGWGTITVAVVGLAASLFVPMAYCRYGCPTGALLKFIRYAGHGDSFGRRDLLALGLALTSWVITYVTRL